MRIVQLPRESGLVRSGMALLLVIAFLAGYAAHAALHPAPAQAASPEAQACRERSSAYGRFAPAFRELCEHGGSQPLVHP